VRGEGVETEAEDMLPRPARSRRELLVVDAVMGGPVAATGVLDFDHGPDDDPAPALEPEPELQRLEPLHCYETRGFPTSFTRGIWKGPSPARIMSEGSITKRLAKGATAAGVLHLLPLAVGAGAVGVTRMRMHVGRVGAGTQAADGIGVEIGDVAGAGNWDEDARLFCWWCWYAPSWCCCCWLY